MNGGGCRSSEFEEASIPGDGMRFWEAILDSAMVLRRERMPLPSILKINSESHKGHKI